MDDSDKSYFLVPNFSFVPPPVGLIALGSIITDPKFPQRSLNKGQRHLIDTADIQRSYQTDFSVRWAQLQNLNLGVFASFLQVLLGVGGDVSVSHKHDRNTKYLCDRLETEYFQPDVTYISQSLRNANVKEYLAAGWFQNRPVYMVTGLKVVRGFSAKSDESRTLGAEGKLGLDGTMIGAPVSGGPKMEFSATAIEEVSFGGASDCVFAFHLIRIRERRDGTLKEKAFVKGATLHGTGDAVEAENFDAAEWSEGWEIARFEPPVGT